MQSPDRHPRETFTSRLGVLATMIGVAVGLGNVWRFPYMAGRFGGGAFLLVYLIAAVLIGIPALMAEWTLGRQTRRGSVGAFERAGLPGGRAWGWFLFAAVTAATAYYSNVIGWVLWHGAVELASPFFPALSGSWILPPEEGLDPRSLGLQFAATATVLGGSAVILLGGLRRGIERASRILVPLLFASLLLVMLRSLSLPGSRAGVHWLLSWDPDRLDAAVVLAAMSQVVFSLALGGTFMVVYGSYLSADEPLGRNAVATVAGDTLAGILAGMAIFPAVFALGLEPSSGPGLLFQTLPEVFATIPLGSAAGAAFFLSLAGGAFLSAVAALEVLVAGLADNTGLGRTRSTLIVSASVLLLAIPPMLSMTVFVPWDLTFGSGVQTLGALLAAVTVGWCLDRSKALAQLSDGRPSLATRCLYLWIRWAIPGLILAVGAWWAATDVLGLLPGG